jgi:hypothetical protein
VIVDDSSILDMIGARAIRLILNFVPLRGRVSKKRRTLTTQTFEIESNEIIMIVIYQAESMTKK